MIQAVTLAPHRVELIDARVPTPGWGEALLQIERVGICGSDLHILHGSHPRAVYPLVQGHEGGGRIIAFGPGYAGPICIGDRVAVDPVVSCGKCSACKSGHPSVCPRSRVLGAQTDGLLREMALAPVSALHAANDLSAELTALCEPISVGVQVARRGGIAGGEQVVVFGAGPIGAAIAIAAMARGARVLAIDRLPFRLDLMKSIGVEMTFVAGLDDVSAGILDWTGGEGPSVAIDAVGHPSVIRQCVELVTAAGRVVVAGVSNQDVCLPVIEFTYKELTIVGSRASGGHFAEAVALVAREQHRLGNLITHHFSLEQAAVALEFAADHPDQSLKVMIDVSGG